MNQKAYTDLYTIIDSIYESIIILIKSLIMHIYEILLINRFGDNTKQQQSKGKKKNKIMAIMAGIAVNEFLKIPLSKLLKAGHKKI